MKRAASHSALMPWQKHVQSRNTRAGGPRPSSARPWRTLGKLVTFSSIPQKRMVLLLCKVPAPWRVPAGRWRGYASHFAPRPRRHYVLRSLSGFSTQNIQALENPKPRLVCRLRPFPAAQSATLLASSARDPSNPAQTSRPRAAAGSWPQVSRVSIRQTRRASQGMSRDPGGLGARGSWQLPLLGLPSRELP
jgi:hypothetical protein